MDDMWGSSCGKLTFKLASKQNAFLVICLICLLTKYFLSLLDSDTFVFYLKHRFPQWKFIQ